MKIFIKLEPKVSICKEQILKIKDIATIYCIDESVKSSILELNINNLNYNKGTQVISIIRIIDIINSTFEDLDIVVFGDPEILIEIENKSNIRPFFNFLKIFFVSTILFLGAALAIINFHEDVNMDESLKKIYYIITGEMNNNPAILYIPYSIGIGIGMFAFFNSFPGKKKKKEPSPLEVEMHLYDKNVQDYILDNTKDKNKMG